MSDTDRQTTFRQAALDYHQYPVPGKTTVVASKPLVTQTDLLWPIRLAWPHPARKSSPIR